MFLESIKVKNFRNYKNSEIFFKKPINVFIGENAQGKTNLLETIYVLAMANSHRTPHDKELINWDEEYAKIEGRVKKKYGDVPLELVISNRGKKAKKNHLEQRKLSQFVGTLNVVMFAPEDLNLVKGSPGNRRRFLDMELGQIQPVYVHELGLYQKVLHQRNALLKNFHRETAADASMLDVLTTQLVELSAQIVHKRFRFIHLLREWAAPIHHSISRGLEELVINYKPSVKDVLEGMELSKIQGEYEKAFQEIRQKEILRGTTLVGPHRDDLKFQVNGKDVQTYGSQGQQRTTALSLKLAEIELIHDEIGDYPILLLDDVLSELDDHRQTHLLQTFKERVQTFVTTTNVGGIDHQMMQDADTFHVQNGEILETT